MNDIKDVLPFTGRVSPYVAGSKKRKPEFVAWSGIMERCGIYKGRNSYVDKGISVDPLWVGPLGFTMFYNHIGPKPEESRVLDRIDNAGNYEPGNVRWATPSESNKNKSNANMLTLFGECKNLVDWASEVGIAYDTVKERIKRGWTVEKALLTRVGREARSRPNLDEWYLEMCTVIQKRATCIRREVGCVLTDEDGYILSTGYNAVPSGVPHCTDEPCEGAIHKSGCGLSACKAIHAEDVALMKCSDIQKVHTCYVSASPCELCIRKLLNTSCQRIVFIEEYPHTSSRSIWEDAGREWVQITLEKFNDNTVS